jgi:hypothetical protein
MKPVEWLFLPTALMRTLLALLVSLEPSFLPTALMSSEARCRQLTL